MPKVTPSVERRFTELLAAIMPFDPVIDEQTAWGDEARVSKTSVCGSWGAIAGTLRYFADRWGVPRAAIEGTQLPKDLVRTHATAAAATLTFDARHKQSPLALERRVTFFRVRAVARARGGDGVSAGAGSGGAARAGRGDGARRSAPSGGDREPSAGGGPA